MASAPVNAPTRRLARRGNTAANAITSPAAPGTSSHPRLSPAPTAASTRRVQRLARLAASVTTAASKAV